MISIYMMVNDHCISFITIVTKSAHVRPLRIYEITTGLRRGAGIRRKSEAGATSQDGRDAGMEMLNLSGKAGRAPSPERE